jgi:hypothetical protein
LRASAAAIAAACAGAAPKVRIRPGAHADELLLGEFKAVTDGVPGLLFLRRVSGRARPLPPARIRFALD